MTRWIAAGGVFLVSLDSTVNVAFPAMAATFAVAPETLRWVIVAYVFAYAVMSFVGGAAADVVGHARVFRLGVAASIIGFVVAGTAGTFDALLVGRFVQGLAGGLVYGTAPGLVTLATPPAARGRALGFLNAALGVALTVGPIIAGVLVDAVGWRSIFHLRVPVALVVLAWSLALASVGAPATRRLVSVADVLRARVLAAGLLAFVANAGIFAIWLLASFYLVGARGLSATASGVVFMLTPLGMTLAAPLAGRVVDRVGAHAPLVAGLVLEAAGLAVMSAADERTSIALVSAALFAAGAGLGIFQVPYMAVVMAAFPSGQQGAAGGFAFLARTLGVVAGVLVLAEVFAARRAAAGFTAAFAEAFVVAAAGVAVAAVLALVLPRTASSRR
ncbi:MAG TPA: MFS transporter [Methylomirabilota bacterium]|jgi:MFS family permease